MMIPLGQNSVWQIWTRVIGLKSDQLREGHMKRGLFEECNGCSWGIQDPFWGLVIAVIFWLMLWGLRLNREYFCGYFEGLFCFRGIQDANGIGLRLNREYFCGYFEGLFSTTSRKRLQFWPFLDSFSIVKPFMGMKNFICSH